MVGNNPQAFENSIEYDLYSTEFGSKLLARYHLESMIYHNNATSVYLLRERATNKKYVLKVIANSNVSLDPDILKALSHPGIVRIEDVGVTESYAYMVKEFLSGITLDKYVEENGPITEEAAICILRQICSIFKYLHGMRDPIIYRDLKPSNIMLIQDGSIRLFDLDSIRQYKDTSSKDTIFLGTEGYAAPEQFGFSQTDVRTDIYTIGTTLYFLLTGKAPVVSNFRLEDISNCRNDLSDSICRIVRKCAMFSPEYRYQSITELEQEISCMYRQARGRDAKVIPGVKRLIRHGKAEAISIRPLVRIAAIPLAAAVVFIILLGLRSKRITSGHGYGDMSVSPVAKPPVLSNIIHDEDKEGVVRIPIPAYTGSGKAQIVGNKAKGMGKDDPDGKIYSIDPNIYQPGGIRRLMLNVSGEYTDVEYSFNHIDWYRYDMPLDFAGSLYIHIRYRKPDGTYEYMNLFIPLEDYDAAEIVETDDD